MKVFIGSSSELLKKAEWIAGILKEDGINAIVWNNASVFIPSAYIFDNLERIAACVDAAIFVFSPDDKTWYRKTPVFSVRDNVLIETGLFAGKLGRANVGICTIGDPKIPTDLLGIQTMDVSRSRRKVKQDLTLWLNNLTKNGEIHLRSRADEEKIISIEERWKYARQIIFVNFAATTFLGSNQIASEHVYSQKLRDLFKRKIEEGTIFKFLLTRPGSYADYDAVKNGKMSVSAHSHIKGKNVISIAAKTVEEECERHKDNIQYRFTDVALPYGAMLIINDDDHSYMNQIKIDLYSPYIQDDKSRRSFTLYADNKENYRFFYENITQMWKNADLLNRHEPYIMKTSKKEGNHHNIGDLDCTIEWYDKDFSSQSIIDIYASTFYMIMSGEMNFDINRETISLVSGDAILVPKQTNYSYKVGQGSQILKISSQY